jgi:hypothetical protein
LPVTGLVLAVAALTILCGGLLIEKSLGDDSCDLLADSTPGKAEWSWMPPGARCSYPSAVVDAYTIVEDPPVARFGEAVLALSLASVSVRLLIVERERRRSHV